MLLKITFFSILNIYFQINGLHLGYHRNSIPRAFPQKIHENSISVHPEILELDQSGRIDTKRSRDNEERNETRSSRKSGSFVNCVFTFEKTGDSGKPAYVCTHSKDVSMKWSEENGRLTGTFMTSLRCPKKRSLGNETKTQWHQFVQELKRSIREKRRTIYRDEEEETQDNDSFEDEQGVVEAIVEGRAAPESQVPRPPDVEEAIADENDKEHPGDDEGEDTNEKEVNEDDIQNVEGSDEDKEVPGVEKDEEGDGRGEKRKVNEIEHQEEEEEKDKELPIPEETKDEPAEDTIVPNVEDQKGEEDVDNEVSASGGTPGEEEVDKEVLTPEETQNEHDVDEEISTTETTTEQGDEDKEDSEEECCSLEQLLEELDLGTLELDIGIGLELIINPEDILNFLAGITETLINAGDYIIALILNYLKLRLYQSRMNERFDKKVEELAKNDLVNIDKAVAIMQKRIFKLFGSAYEILLIKFLKELQDHLKLR